MSYLSAAVMALRKVLRDPLSISTKGSFTG